MVELLSRAEPTARVSSGVAILAPMNGGQCNSNWTKTGQWGGAWPISIHFDRSKKIPACGYNVSLCVNTATLCKGINIMILFH